MSASSQSPENQPRTSVDRRLPYINTGDGYREATAPAYCYEPLDLEKEEIRILVLLPCPGDKNDPYNYVKCTLEVQPLKGAAPFIAIKNGRGYRLLEEVIEIDDKSFLVATALEKFLRNLRKSDTPVRLWVRYICVDQQNPNEMSQYWNRGFVDKAYAQAQTVLDMHATLKGLLHQGVIEKSVDTRYKEWDKNWDSVPKKYPLPKVYPIRLGKSPSIVRPTDDHEYVPLDVVANEIRIIVVANNPDPEAPLVLHLAHCPTGSDVVYHALSYTWGAENEWREIVVNGLKIRIRKNLEVALRSLRSPTNGLAIWADAICINQSDAEEKNEQLPELGRIVDKATAVICYVGEPDQHSDLALDFVKHLQEPVIRTDEHGDFEVGKPERISPEELPRYCAVLYLFLLRPYFRRAWVLQEVTLASNPVIACGERRGIHFEQLDSAAYNLQDMLSRSSELVAKMKRAVPGLHEVVIDELVFVRKLFYFRHLHMGRVRNGFITVDIKDNVPGYLETAILSRDFQATVSHDKIFALWNIAKDKDGLEFHMDYSKTYEETYVAFAKAWALHSGSLDILGAAEYIHPTERLTFYARAPSWCPDWSRPSQSSSLVRREVFRKFKMAFQDDKDGPIYSADGGVRQERRANDFFNFVGNELHCLGVILDTVLADVEYPDGALTESKIKGLVPSTADFCAQHNMRKYEDISQAVVAMLHGDVPASWPRREDNLTNAEAEDPEEQYVCIPHKPRLNQEQPQNASRHVPSFGGTYSRQEAWEAICTIMRGRKLFITEKGYIGLMPEYVRGDHSAEQSDSGLRLAILAACSVPVLLYEDPDVEGRYRLLGTCFVQGWMEGEVLREEMGCDAPEEFWSAMLGSEKLRIV